MNKPINIKYDDKLCIFESINSGYYSCNKCHKQYKCEPLSANYCPNCGRKIHDFITIDDDTFIHNDMFNKSHGE